MRSSMVAPAGSVWSKKCAPTMCEAWRSAARRRRGFSRSGGSRWRALGVVQAQHGGADRLEVGPARLDVGVGAALRVGAGRRGESGESERDGKATRPAEGDGREHGE